MATGAGSETAYCYTKSGDVTKFESDQWKGITSSWSKTGIIVSYDTGSNAPYILFSPTESNGGRYTVKRRDNNKSTYCITNYGGVTKLFEFIASTQTYTWYIKVKFQLFRWDDLYDSISGLIPFLSTATPGPTTNPINYSQQILPMGESGDYVTVNIASLNTTYNVAPDESEFTITVNNSRTGSGTTTVNDMSKVDFYIALKMKNTGSSSRWNYYSVPITYTISK